MPVLESHLLTRTPVECAGLWRPALGPILMLGLAFSVHAGNDSSAEAPDAASWKLTSGLYALSGGGQRGAQALDENLRRSGQWGNGWLGWYGQTAEGPRQWRTGWDRFFDAGVLRIQPSLQLASGGFRGGSVYAEAGQAWFAGLGAGRTNLRPYVNLNFDPNDMVMLALGRRAGGEQLQLQWVADTRQNPDQRHLHLNWRQSTDGGERRTWDLLYKRGDVEGERIHRLGLSVTQDWPGWSLRAAWDPRVNFTPQNMWRVSLARRF